MFSFLVKFLKIMVIACIIGVLLRAIDIIFLKQEATNIETSNITNEIQNEERTEIESDTIVIEEQKNDVIIEKETEQENNQQTTVNTNKPVENTQSSSDKTNQTQSNKNTTTQTNKDKTTQDNKIPISTPIPAPISTPTPMPTPTTKPTVQIPKCEGNKHGIETGNSGRWFNTESEAIAIYDAEIKKWGDKWTSGEIDKSTYLKNCPAGYEDWSCPYCHKWTINFYYR